MQKGSIGVTTENIFPVIKKFLYSDHEIFLRQLVSNAVDATQKLKTLSSCGEYTGNLGDLKVNVSIDSEKGTLTVSDSGISMTAEDIEKYINQKQMGAYYTKEDITEYISKNTIIPYLFEEAKKKCEVAFKYWQIFGSPEEIAQVESECKAGKRGCADCKRQLAQKVNEHFKEIRERRKYYENHMDEVKAILEEGTLKSRAVSSKILADVRNIIGMY